MSGRARRLAAFDARVQGLERPTPEGRRGPAPYQGTILDAMTDAGMTGASWAAWRTFWRAVFALPMDAEDLAAFQRHTGRTTPPAVPVREVFQVIGRRGGRRATRRCWRCGSAAGGPTPRSSRRGSGR